jgi:5-methylthioadenosine/S-adenosylhomocysteine deaminase
MIDLLVKGGTILCLDAGMRVLSGHALAIARGRIVGIVPLNAIPYRAAKEIDASGCIVMPGLINAHSHLPMTYFRGLADDLPLEKWLHKFIWPLEARMLTRDFIFDASLHGAAEMIKGGITMTHEMYFNMPAIADACSQAGLRALIGEAVLDLKADPDELRDSLGGKVAELTQRYADNPLIDFDLAPHSIYGCSRPTLQHCVRVAKEQGVRLHMHLSETRAEVEQCLSLHGMKPVQYLKEIGMLEVPAVFAHGIWVDGDEIALLADSPASIAICTESNLKLGSGIAPLAGYLRKSVNVCLATDGVASNNNLDLLAEMDVTAKLHKVVNDDPSFLPAPEVVRMATVNAARALGVEDRRGSLEEGKDADICILSLDGLQCHPLYNPYSHVVYALGSSQVRDVVINGEVVLEQGKLTKVDERALIAAAKTYQARISAELGL